jgi:hypothetical protein
MIDERRISRYMKGCVEHIRDKVGENAKVYLTGFSIKERRPNGIYRTNKAFTGAAGNALGLKIVDDKVDGTLYLSVKYEPSHRKRVEAVLNSILQPDEIAPEYHGEKDNTFLDSQVSWLLSDAEHVRRVRKGPVLAGNSYPLGLHVLRRHPHGIEAVVADDEAYMPVFIEAHKGMGAELGKKYFPYSTLMT